MRPYLLLPLLRTGNVYYVRKRELPASKKIDRGGVVTGEDRREAPPE